MRHITVAALATILLLAGGAAAYLEMHAPPRALSFATAVATGHDPSIAPAALSFRELLEKGPRLVASQKAKALDGKRVRFVGFMAELEDPLEGAFYLVPQPVKLDESGGGTGDLPPESVLIVVPGADGKQIPYVSNALEAIGTFEVGNRSDRSGHVSNFRLHLEGELPSAHW